MVYHAPAFLTPNAKAEKGAGEKPAPTEEIHTNGKNIRRRPDLLYPSRVHAHHGVRQTFVTEFPLVFTTHTDFVYVSTATLSPPVRPASVTFPIND